MFAARQAKRARNNVQRRGHGIEGIVQRTRDAIRGLDLRPTAGVPKDPPPVPPKDILVVGSSAHRLSLLQSSAQTLTTLSLSRIDIPLNTFFMSYPPNNPLTRFTMEECSRVSLRPLWTFLNRCQDKLEVLEMDRWTPWISLVLDEDLQSVIKQSNVKQQRQPLSFLHLPSALSVTLPLDWAYHILSCAHPNTHVSTIPPPTALVPTQMAEPWTMDGSDPPAADNAATLPSNAQGTSWSMFSFSSEPVPRLTSIVLICRSQHSEAFTYDGCSPILGPILSFLQPRVIGAPSSSPKLSIRLDISLHKDRPWQLDHERAVLNLKTQQARRSATAAPAGSSSAQTVSAGRAPTKAMSSKHAKYATYHTSTSVASTKNGNHSAVPNELGVYTSPSPPSRNPIECWDIVTSLLLSDYPMPSDQFTAFPLTQWICTFFPRVEKVSLSSPRPESPVPNTFPSSSRNTSNVPPSGPSPIPPVSTCVSYLVDSIKSHWSDPWFPPWTEVEVDGIKYSMDFGEDLAVFPLVDPSAVSFQISSLSDAV